MRTSIALAVTALAMALAPPAQAAPPGTGSAPLESTPAAHLAANDCDEVELMGPVDAPVAPPGGCRGVRPGAWVKTSLGRCSFNFMFSGSDGRTYAGTAGHCVYKDDQWDETTWQPGAGPGAWDAEEVLIGEFAYATLGYVCGNGACGDTDFALVRLDDDVEVDPSMCHWGGPTGLWTGGSGRPDSHTVVRHYGGGVALGDTVPARTGLLTGAGTQRDEVHWSGAVLWGDSGSGLITEDGEAVGVNVRLSVGAFNNASTRIDFQLPLAEAALGIDLELLTAPLEVRS